MNDLSVTTNRAYVICVIYPGLLLVLSLVTSMFKFGFFKF